jgi:hypothetical protein
LNRLWPKLQVGEFFRVRRKYASRDETVERLGYENLFANSIGNDSGLRMFRKNRLRLKKGQSQKTNCRKMVQPDKLSEK